MGDSGDATDADTARDPDSAGDGSGCRRDREDVRDATDGAGGRPCPVCDRPMTHRHCKYVCPVHGVVYDCSDTFY